MKKTALGLTALFAVLSLTYSPSHACSVCRCGDNAFQFADQALPLAGQVATHHLRLSFADSYSSKSNALDPEEGQGTEREREWRPSIKAQYQFLNHFAVSAKLPLSFRHLAVNSHDGTDRESSSGIGDAEVTTLWMTSFSSAGGRYYSAGLSADVKLPTGSNNSQRDGERLDEHLQTGTGSYDVVIGGAFSRSTCSGRAFASVYSRRNGTNDFGYHYGNAVLANFGLQRWISSSVIGSLQLNSRHAAGDVEGGDNVDNTGGSVAYITPGVRVGLNNVVSLSLSAQVPVWQDLYGDQTEHSVLITGVNVSL